MFTFYHRKKELEWYVYESSSAIIVESLVSKSPVQKVDQTPTVTIEKMIVDIFSDQRLFNVYQGAKLANIIESAYDKYQCDFTKLFSYAKKKERHRSEKLFSPSY